MISLVRRLPTTDLYFANALPHVAQSGEAVPPVRQIGRHCYWVGGVAVVSRYVNRVEIALIKALKPRRVVYIIDDDLTAGINDPGLHAGYRKRLQALRDGGQRRVLEIATDVIVPSARLAALYDGGPAVHQLHPLWHRPFADLKHFPDAVAGTAPFKIVFLGTRSHLADLALLQKPLMSLLQRRPEIEFHLRLGNEAPEALSRLPNVHSAPQVGWRRYRTWIGTERFHLALYPLRSNAFNAARSSNKLFEHAVVGAASLMSPTPATGDLLGGALSEIFVETGADQWAQRIETLTSRPLLAQTLAARTLMHLNTLDSAADHVRLWRRLLAR